ncbi:GyrI-like domain-containing protein [Mucilaginibacter sp.]|uniref:GyrI-like domain-containing protein n=1 Tax=Mucilaginibacter sp. TaxID=1882438 RepID=UPI00284934BF|nr:GyrI-like domain-containing protein [Mucilaginibacter sp.]MDR3693942.1 GyrI-like domain-containing protein [Mucilaginibacter sp.]
MKKLDLKKDFAELYKVSANKISLVTVPKLNYLMIDGHGDPNNSAMFREAIEALFSVSYTMKFMFKKGEQQIDYSVMPLEGLWWTDDMNNFSMENKAAWKWTIMIMQPDFITNEVIEQAKQQAGRRKALPRLNNLRLESMEEGLCAQLLHTGPYSAEGPNILKLHAFIKENGYKLHGKHREIYLSDMRRTAPEKLKTIIRQPVTQ